MNPVRNFSEFVVEGVAKKQRPDLPRAKFLVIESEKTYLFISEIITAIGVNDVGANSIIKLSYDTIMDLIRADMLVHGYNSAGQGAHQAEVSYMREIGFSENDVQFADRLRYFRNSIMYYGKILDKEYAEKVIEFMNRVYPKLISRLNVNAQKIIRIPTKEECMKILKYNKVQDNIVAHSKAVCEFSIKVCDLLERRGIHVNSDLVAAAALLHDIKKLSQNDHVIEGTELIKSLGFPEVAEVIKKHGLYHLNKEDFVPKTWEEKIVFYADKRVKNDKIVSIDERFEYLKQRYKKDDKTLKREMNFTEEIEKELLGNEMIN